MSSTRISEEVRARVRFEAQDQCGYCCSLQKYVLGMLEIEHIIPKATGGTDEEKNLWLACRLCNNFKGTQTHRQDPETGRQAKLFNPRTQRWNRHFTWSADGTHIIGRTAIGRATVITLQLNNTCAVMVRQQWIGAGWHPPQEP